MSDDQDTIIEDEPLKFLSLFRKREVNFIQFTHQKYLQLYDALCCTICKELFDAPVYLKCSHRFCKQCIEKYVRFGGKKSCPNCRGDLSTRRDLRTDYGINTLIQYAFGDRKKFCQEVQQIQNVQASSMVFKRTESGIQSRVRPKISLDQGKTTRKKLKPNQSLSKVIELQDLKKLRKKRESNQEIIISQDILPQIQRPSIFSRISSEVVSNREQKIYDEGHKQTKNEKKDLNFQDQQDNLKLYNNSSSKKNNLDFSQSIDDQQQQEQFQKDPRKKLSFQKIKDLVIINPQKPKQIKISVIRQPKKRGRKKKAQVIQVKSSGQQVEQNIFQSKSAIMQQQDEFFDNKVNFQQKQKNDNISAENSSLLLKNSLILNNSFTQNQKNLQNKRKSPRNNSRSSRNAIENKSYSPSASSIDLQKYKVSQKNSESEIRASSQIIEAEPNFNEQFKTNQNLSPLNEIQLARKILKQQLGQRYLQKLLEIPTLSFTIPIRLQKHPNHPFTPSIKCKKIKLSVQAPLQSITTIISRFLNIQKQKIKIYIKLQQSSSSSIPNMQALATSFSSNNGPNASILQQISTKENISKKLYQINQKYWKIVKNIQLFDMKDMLQALQQTKNNQLDTNKTNFIKKSNILKELQLQEQKGNKKYLEHKQIAFNEKNQQPIPALLNKKSTSKIESSSSILKEKTRSKEKNSLRLSNKQQKQKTPQKIQIKNNMGMIDQLGCWRVIYYRVELNLNQGPLIQKIIK